jgi:hypothetical protein
VQKNDYNRFNGLQSVQWGLLPIYVKYTVTRGTHVFIFLSFHSPGHYSPNRKSYLDHNASVDADFLNEVPFRGVEIFKTNFKGHICPKIEINS